MINRRHFLKSSTAIAPGLCGLSGLAIAQGSQKNLADLHNEIATCVKQLLNGKPLSLTLLYPQGSFSNLEPIVKQFSANTSVTIKPLEVGLDDINSTIIFNATQNKYLFDIALPASFSLHELASVDALQVLNTYQEKYEPSDYKNDQLYDYSDYIGDAFYGYQTDGDAYLMFYNKAMLDNKDNQARFAENHNYPLAVPTRWEQLDDMIRFFHQPEQQQYGGCLFRVPGYGAWEWWSRFHAKGYYPLDDTLTPQINNEAGIKALQEMLDISAYLHPNVAGDGLFDNWKTFSQGQTFCNIGWGGSQKAFNKAGSKLKDNLYYAPAPGGKINGQEFNCPIFNWGWNYVVSSACPEPEIAYLFSLYACSPVISTLSVQQDGFFDPYREEHYADSAIQAIYTPEFLSAHRTSMDQSIPDFYLHKQSTYSSVLQENIALAYKGTITAKQALDLTAVEWQRVTQRVGKEKQQQAWLDLKQKYPDSLKKVLR